LETRPQSVAADVAYDTGLRNFFLMVYNRVGLGLVLTALMAFIAAHDPVKSMLFHMVNGHLTYTMLGWIVAFGPIVLLVTLGIATGLASNGAGAIAFWGTAALFGLSFGSLLLRYSGVSIASTFLETAAAFGGLSLFGYTTKKDLSGWGSFLIVALLGLIVAMVATVFIHSTMFALAINLIGILIFAGFIAYDTQKLKDIYEEYDGDTNAAYLGALNLYLDFINLFLLLLRLTGQISNDGGSDD
jgi:hypothetical protein